jgi:hypothetical protein
LNATVKGEPQKALNRRSASPFGTTGSRKECGIVATALATECVYTTHRSSDLEQFLATGGTGEVTEEKNWKGGSDIVARAEAEGERVALLLSAAESDEMNIEYVALLTDVVVTEPDEDRGWSTTYSFEGLRRIDPARKKSEVRKRDGTPLSDQFLRPYALCRTPSFITG